MPATATLTEIAETTVNPEILKAAKQAIANTNWDAYWRKVGERVAEDVDAYADARAKSWEEFNHRMLR